MQASDTDTLRHTLQSQSVKCEVLQIFNGSYKVYILCLSKTEQP